MDCQELLLQLLPAGDGEAAAAAGEAAAAAADEPAAAGGTAVPGKAGSSRDGMKQLLHRLGAELQRERKRKQPAAAEQHEDAGKCVVCLDAPYTVYLQPCRHLCLCAACADRKEHRITACPLCREPIAKRMRILPV